MRNKISRGWVALVWLAGGCLWVSCSLRGGEPDKKAESDAGTEAVAVAGQAEVEKAQDEAFPFPQIPAVLTNPEERRRYLLAHYWDAFDFADTVLLHNAGVTEQGLVNYIDLVATHPDVQEADEALDAFCRAWAASNEARKTLPPLLEKYLYDPMSPMRNDALYVRFLDRLLAYAPAGDARRSRWTFLRALAGRNNPGQAATDFAYYLPDGTRRTLYGTEGKCLLLFFYDPECENCHAVLEEMKRNGALAEAVRSGRVTVLSVYTEGNPQAWRARLAEMPQGWLVGTDREAVKNRSLYDLKAMPTLYLLDGSKKVVLKDASFGQIAEALGF